MTPISQMQEVTAVAPSGVERIAAMLAVRRSELAEESLRAIRAAVPAYAAITDPNTLADVTEHVAENHDALRASLLRGVRVTAEELAFIRPHAGRRARHGVTLADFLHAFRIGHRVIWDAILKLADEHPEVGSEALTAAGLVMEFIDLASTHAAQTYLDAQQLLLAEGDRVRRDVLEDLLAGREPPPGPRLAAARATGLAGGGRCVLIAAVPVNELDDELALRSAGSALARAVGGAVRPLTVVRHDEIVIVRSLAGEDARGLTEPIERTQRELTRAGVSLAIGISTAFDTTAGLPDAYCEASTALQSLSPDGGVLALPELSAFDYLTLRSDATARRLVSTEVRRFVEDDLASGGTLTGTLLAYAEANLNAKVAAGRLYIHVNTAHHRLARIEEKTGRDLRDLADVQELLIAIKLASGQSGRQAAPNTRARELTPPAAGGDPAARNRRPRP